ncbi:Ribosomal RNA small subunit methyltransferase G [Linum perenne]
MMSIGRYRPSNVSFLCSMRFFLEHLPNPTFVAYGPARFQAKSVAAVRIHSSSYFETLNSRQQDQIRLYVDVLLQWNQKMNLTAVTAVEEVMERHVEDSLALIPPLNNSYASHCSGSFDSMSVVDVGTGPGLPGLILAIACPGWQVTLMESMKKRCDFLEHAVDITGLSNVQVLRGRAEVFISPVSDVKRCDLHSLAIGQNLGRDVHYREKFDVAVARAVAEMRILVEYCLPLVRVGGLFVAAKGHDPLEEVKSAEKSIKLMGASLLQVHPVKSHSQHGQRTAIICLKSRSTPKKYPREPGIPVKLPL